MLLTLTCTARDAPDLGYLLHKHPNRAQTFELTFGKAHVFFPEVSAERCTAALSVEVDPIGLIRKPGAQSLALEQYVNDRPYTASSYLSVAIAEVFRSALSGQCRAKPDLATTPLPLEATVTVVPARGGAALLRRLFEPLGYAVHVTEHLLDETRADWGMTRNVTLRLRATTTLSMLLSHLYVLLPVLDDDKHYWVGDDEVEKLIKHGQGWLSTHAEKELITERYLKHRRSLVTLALEHLDANEAPSDEALPHEEPLEQPLSLNEQRLGTVLGVLKQIGAKRVIDLGCGEGRLVREVIKDRSFEHITGVDVSHRALEHAARKLERLPDLVRARAGLLHGSLTYRDARFAGFDAATCIEVIEHLDADRLIAFERVLFEFARPKAIVLTTPNAEYNVRFESLPLGRLRHADHRFEWTRAEFQAWATRVATQHRYAVRFLPVGPEDVEVGAPTQLAVFT